MRKSGLILLVLLLSLSLVLTGCGGTKKEEPKAETPKVEAPKEEVKPVKLIAAHVTPEEGSYQVGMLKFKEVVEKESNGSITVEIHPNGQLGGNEDELVQKMATGTVDVIVASPGFMTQTVKEIDLLALPYLFASYDHWKSVLDGEVGQKMAGLVEEKTDFKFLGWWKCGVRVYFGNKPVNTPADLKDVKIRIQVSPVTSEVWSTFGAQPSSVAFNELYQALQNKVVDAAENDFANILQMKFHEAAPNISLTNHDIATRLLLMSDKKYQSLSPEQKAAVDKAVVAATEAERVADNDLAGVALEQLIAEGAIVNEVDVAPFIEMTQPIRDKVAKSLGLEDILKKIAEMK
ncbi:MAG: hypothetical protein JM58_15605 [Peptococcaceae bacterium BICA1-8]|nr:MAG: hypothetical protein JM58_15605 [Peptococcaceae bacterium BICA1-8]